MPVRVPLITDVPARVLLDSIVDYAGLFPPAGLSMALAVRNFAQYRGSAAGWMLGRFVCSVKAFEQFNVDAEPLLPRDAGAIPWRLSAVGTGSHESDVQAITAMNDANRWGWDGCSALIDTFETRVTTVSDIHAVHAAAPATLTTYLEVPINANATALIDAAARTGSRVKLRTGGVTADAFATPEQLLQTIGHCVAVRVPFKATAGLHHALRGPYALTYEPDSATAPMYGYLNVFLSAGLLAMGVSANDVAPLLVESDTSALTVTDDAITWRGHTLDRAHLAHVREHVAISFGSCSFTEPVNEARALGMV